MVNWARGRPTRAWSTRAAALLAFGLLGVGLTQLPLSGAAFTASANNGPNSFAAKATFCTSPGSSSLAVTHDATVEMGTPTTNYNNIDPNDVQAKAGDDRRILFDVTLPTIPAGCAMTAASLWLNVVSVAPGRTFDVTRLAAAFDYSTVTWNSQPAVTGAAGIGVSANPTTVVDATAAVQGLYANGNTGLQLRDANEGTAITFLSTFSAVNSTPALLVVAWA